MAGMIDAAVVRETLGGSWDVACAVNMLLEGQWFVTPTWNMVENSGLVQGTHADGDPGWELAWEPEHAPAGPVRFAPPSLDEHLLTAYRKFFSLGAAVGPLQRAGSAIARRRAARRLRSPGA